VSRLRIFNDDAPDAPLRRFFGSESSRGIAATLDERAQR